MTKSIKQTTKTHSGRDKKSIYHVRIPDYPEFIPTGIFTLSRLIRVMRLSRGYTQKRLADALGTKRQHVQKWEYGITKPRPERMAQILDVLKYQSLTAVINKYYHSKRSA